MAQGKKLKLKSLYDFNLAVLIQKANDAGIADKEIVQILKMGEQYVLIYKEETK